MEETVRELFNAGRQQFENKNYARAEQLFLKILRLGTRYADVLNMLGVIYHVQGKFNNAIECFEESLKINPQYTEGTLNLAVLYNDLGEYKKAKELYRRVRMSGKKLTEIDPILKGKIANMHAALGDIYRGIGRYADAIEEYKKALKLSPTFVDIRTKLGISYRENHQNDLAAKELSAVLNQKPAYSQARIQLGLTYYTTGKNEKAASCWRDVLKKDKENETAKMYLRVVEAPIS